MVLIVKSRAIPKKATNLLIALIEVCRLNSGSEFAGVAECNSVLGDNG